MLSRNLFIQKIEKALSGFLSKGNSTENFELIKMYAVGVPIRWVIPAEPKYAQLTLSEWKPYGILSLVKWNAFIILYRLGLVKFFSSVDELTLSLPESSKYIPVIYVGTPGEQQKAVITLVEVANIAPVTVIKVALEYAACGSLLVEANTLVALQEKKVTNVPQLQSISKDNTYSSQSIVPGKLSTRTLSKIHINLLLSLAGASMTLKFSDYKAAIVNNITKNKANICNEQLVICKKALTYIRNDSEIPAVIVHGDFAPWNLKVQKSDALAAIDWEDSKLVGLPLWDLCHFYFIQEHLFQDLSSVDQLFDNILIDSYFERLNIAVSDKKSLILLYCLNVLLSDTQNISDSYKIFLLQQVCKVIAR